MSPNKWSVLEGKKQNFANSKSTKYCRGKSRERDRDRDRDREIETERGRDRQTDRQRQSQRERQRWRDRERRETDQKAVTHVIPVSIMNLNEVPCSKLTTSTLLFMRSSTKSKNSGKVILSKGSSLRRDTRSSFIFCLKPLRVSQSRV